MKPILERISEGDVLVCDGAMGTFLQQKGLQMGTCPEAWCLHYPAEIKDIYQQYRDAGSDMIECNSFGGSRYKLEQFGLGEQTVDINKAAASLAREVADGTQYVLATMGPTGEFMEPYGLETEAGFYNAFKEQAQALEQGGADAVIIETMMSIDEAAVATKAARENTDLVVIASFTFDPEGGNRYASMMGVTPQDFAQRIIQERPDIVSTNCGTGPADMIEIVRQLQQELPDTPLMAMPNAGMPEVENGVTVYKETPEQMAQQVPDLLKTGASIIGGCCGTGPAHITAIKEAVKQHKK